MANHKSAKKRALRNSKKAGMNKARLSRLKKALKSVEIAIASGDAKAADAALKKAQPALYREASKGIVNKNAAARKMSRLSSRVKSLKKPAKA